MSELAKEWKEVPGEKGSDDGGVEESPLHLYYDGRKGCYYRQDEAGGYIIQKEAGVRRFLKAQGLSGRTPPDGELSPLENSMEQIERRHSVDFVGDVAGHRAGFYKMGGTRVLVTRSPEFVKPRPGEWGKLRVFFDSLLPGDQAEWYFGWLAHTVKALYAGTYRPGQAVIIAGEGDCGKSLMTEVVTKILGGRLGKPMAYLSGRTQFNGELAASEHLVADDDYGGRDPRSRDRLGAMIRNIVADRRQRIEAKGRQAIQVRPFWRLTMLLNPCPSSLSVLPQMERSLADKITLLYAEQGVLPVSEDDPDREEKLWKCFSDELPAFVHYLINEHVIRDEWTNARFGIKSMHDKRVMDLMEPPKEDQLWELIIKHWRDLRSSMSNYEDGPGDIYHGPARDIKDTLMQVASDRVHVEGLFYGGVNMCGNMLRDLKRKLNDIHPGTIIDTPPKNGIKWWKITRPPADE